MNSFHQFALFVRWPIAVGILIALILVLFFPEQLNLHTPKHPLTQQFDRQWRGPVSYAKAVNRASAAVVNIYSRKQQREKRHPFFNDPYIRRYFNISDIPRQERVQQTLGSGVIVSERGFILTNLHVIEGADEIAVALQDGRETRAEVMGVNRERDLAVLHIPLEDIPAISIGNVNKLRVGDVVLAIGNPLGIGQTVTQGIISATQRKDLQISTFEGFIQTDAAINPGNSGGALIDAYGNLLGINVANLDKSSSGYSAGIGFAIPVDIAIQTLNDIVEHGRVVRGWLGVEAQLVTPEIAAQLHLAVNNGILISRTNIGSPAEKAGLRAGDVIVSINNQKTEDIITGWQRIAESRPGETVSIEFLRGGVIMQTNAVLGELPAIFK